MDLNKSVVSPDIVWKIHNVVKERLTDGKTLKSSKFEILIDDDKVTKWYFVAKIKDSNLGIFLHTQEPGETGFSTKCEIFIRTLNNEMEKNNHFVKDFSTFKGGWGWPSVISVSELFENSDKYLKNGTLTIGAKIELIRISPEELDDEASTTDCQHFVMFENYLNTKLFSDITFVCSDGIEIQAHRLILADASPVFNEMIMHGPSSIINVDDIDSGTMTEILRYIYTEEVDDIDVCSPKLIYGAEKYGLDGLKKVCSTSMIENLSVENAVDYLLLADQYDIKELLDSCIEFIKVNYHLVKNEADWKKLENKHLNMLLEYYKQNPECSLILESSFSSFH